MTAHVPAAHPPALEQVSADAVRTWMASGMAFHEGGDPVQALVAFEAALALAPNNAQVASACATLLFELARPKAALTCLKSVEQQLLADADGATNLAIAASACGDHEGAKAYFYRALALHPEHTRALHQLATLHAQAGHWDEAIACATRCMATATDQDWAWLAVADLLLSARRSSEAVAHLDQALQRFPAHPALTLRHALALAVVGEIEASDHLLASLGTAPRSSQNIAGDAHAIFCQHAFEALQECDWRVQSRLLARLKHDLDGLNASAPAVVSLDVVRSALVCGPVLPIGDGDMRLAERAMRQALTAGPAKPGRPFSASDVLNRQGPIRIGIAAQSLRDEAATAELAALLAVHDTSRFEFRVYSPTPQPQASLAAMLAPHRVIEIAHFNDDEAIARIRLDRPDIWLDLTFRSPWWRPAIAARRVAPVQVRHPDECWQETKGAFEYTLTDAFIHPASDATLESNKALIRLPCTCWPASPDTASAALVTRDQAALPAQALVLCAFAPALHIDAHTFGLWMQLLGQLPAAVLWLPPLSSMAQANLQREAEAAGIAASRLCFAVANSRKERLGCLALADLFLDPLRMNVRQDLHDALALGVPAISCAGSSMASRIGGSILVAAGLSDCVVATERAYVEAVVRLGRDRAALQQLRVRVKAARATAALFDLPARVREFEAAWTFMAARARAGEAPAGCDLPAQQF